MPTTAVKQVPCPNCAKLVVWSVDNPYRPFCSRRCKLIDLGEWANEGYRIAGELVDSNDESGMNEGGMH